MRRYSSHFDLQDVPAGGRRQTLSGRCLCSVYSGGFSFPRPFRSSSFSVAYRMIRRRPHRTVGSTPLRAAFRSEFFEILVSSLALANETASGRSIVAVCMLLISPSFWLLRSLGNTAKSFSYLYCATGTAISEGCGDLQRVCMPLKTLRLAWMCLKRHLATLRHPRYPEMTCIGRTAPTRIQKFMHSRPGSTLIDESGGIHSGALGGSG
jgi:hypothetical protein